MDIKVFEKRLKYLKKHNYKTLTMAEFECFHRGVCEIPRLNISNDMTIWKFKLRINIPK